MTFDFQTFDTPKYERWLIIEIGLILVAFALGRLILSEDESGRVFRGQSARFDCGYDASVADASESAGSGTCRRSMAWATSTTGVRNMMVTSSHSDQFLR